MQPAELASVPVDPVDDAVLLPGALVVDDGALAAAEESLAALARDHAVVDAGRLVAADLARDNLDLGWKKEKERKRALIISQIILHKNNTIFRIQRIRSRQHLVNMIQMRTIMTRKLAMMSSMAMHCMLVVTILVTMLVAIHTIMVTMVGMVVMPHSKHIGCTAID